MNKFYCYYLVVKYGKVYKVEKLEKFMKNSWFKRKLKALFSLVLAVLSIFKVVSVASSEYITREQHQKNVENVSKKKAEIEKHLQMFPVSLQAKTINMPKMVKLGVKNGS